MEWGFVWVVWLVLSLVHLGAAIQLNTTLPRLDDWILVRSYLGWSKGSTAELLSPFDVHLVPGLKALLFAIWHMGGVSLTYTGILSAVLLVLGTGVGMALVLSKLPRDRDIYLHATIPLLLMGVVPIDLVTLGLGLGLVVFCVGSFFVLCLFAGELAGRSWKIWALVWVLLCLLCVMNTMGVIFAIPVGLALCAGANRAGVVNRTRFVAVAVLGATAILAYVLLASWIFLGEIRARIAGDSTYVGVNFRSVSTALQFLASPFGDLAWRLWPLSGLIIACFWVATLWLWLRLRGRVSFMEWLVMAAGALGFFMIAASVGMGRWWQGGFTWYYVPYVVPIYFIAYLLWCRAGGLGRIVRIGMFATLCGVSLWTQGVGKGRLREYRESEICFLQEIARGVPSIGLAADNKLRAGEMELEGLRAMGVPPFSRIKPAPIMEPKLVSSQHMRWHDAHFEGEGRVQTQGENSFLEISLPNPEHIYAVRLEYSHQSARKFLTMRLMVLRLDSEPVFGRLLNKEVNRSFWREVDREHAVQLFWVDSPVESLALFPDTVPCQFEIHKLEVLTKPSEISTQAE